MNYAGKFEAIFAQGQGTASPAHVVHGDQVHAHAPADAIVVPDAHLLFNGDFKRSGVDLILSEGEREFVLHDYFKGEKRAALASPDGAHLTGDLVNALAGSVQVGQAGPGASAGQVIGHVTKLAGNATVVRNGVSIILHMGDNVEKGDVLQSGSDSTVGVTFMDGTVFGLSSNARMVLNEMIYDPNGSSNSTLFNLVAGTISFVAGETAKHGDMKIDTPVATMGIRGTAVLVEIDFTVPGQTGTPNAKFQVLVEPDGTTGSYILFDKTTLQPIAVVNQAGQQVNITNGVVSQTQNPLSPELQKLINDVFTLKFTDNTNPNPKTTVTQNDSLTPFSGPTIKLADGTTATPLFVNLNSGTSHQDFTLSVPDAVPLRIAGPPQAVMLDASGHVTTQFAITERIGQTNSSASDGVIGTVNFVDSNRGDAPSVSVSFSGASYHGHASPGAIALADIAATEVKISVVPADGNSNTGSAQLTYSIPDKAFDFLAEGETLTLTYTAEVNNNFAPDDESTFITFTITVTGSNDAPVITTAAQTVAFSGGTKTSGGPLTTDNPTSGTLAFTDPDLTDTHKVSSALKGVTLDGKAFDLEHLEPTPFKILNTALTAKLAADSTGTGTGSVTWTLADLPAYVADFIPKGETLTLTYEVTVTDSQGATSTKDVTVTITGTEPAAEVWISTRGDGQDHDWNNGINWETGNAPTAADDVIVITDQLHNLTPSFPVTIGSAVHAEAKSVSMNDFDHTPPELVNDGTLTVGGALKLEADSILENFGTITLGGLAEILNQSTLTNSGRLVLSEGGDFQDRSSVSNTGTIEIKGGTLDVSVDIANSDGEDGSGLIQVDAGATLVLNSATVIGGSITIEGCLDTEESNSPAIATFDVKGVSTLEGVTVNNDGFIDISGSLTLELNTALTNLAGTGHVTVESEGLLTLNGASITNATLDNSGDIDVTGTGNAFDGGSVSNSDTGTIEVTGTLILDDGAQILGGSLTNSGVLDIETATGAVLDGVSIDNSSGRIDVDSAALPASKLTLKDVTTISGGSLTIGALASLLEISTGANATLSTVQVANSGTVQVDDNSSLTLVDTTITGGTLTVSGTLDAESASLVALGTLTIQGASVFDGVTTDNSGLIDVTGSLTLQHGTVIANQSGLAAVTVEGGAMLTLDDSSGIVGGTIDNSGLIHVEDASGATLDGVSVNNAVAQAPVGEIKVDTDTASTLVVEHGTTITGGTLIIGDEGTLEVSGSGATLSGVGVSNSNMILVDDDATLTLSGKTTIDHGTIDDYGKIDVTGTTTMTGVTASGAVSVEAHATLTLHDTSFTGGTLCVSGTLDSEGSSAIYHAEITHGGLLQVNCGTLTIDGTLSGNAEIVGTSVLKLADSYQDAYDDAIITFATGASGTLELDSAATFSGTVANFDDDDRIDLSHVAYDSDITTTYSNGILTVVDGTKIAQIKVAGDNSGAHFVAVSDHHGGTFVEEVPGAISGLDAHGNAVEGQKLTASITDAGAGVTDAHYQWQLDGEDIDGATSACFTPTEADEGHRLSVKMSFVDTNGEPDTSCVSGGTVQERVGGDLAATYSSETAHQDQQIKVTGVTDGGTDVLQLANYSWQTLNGAEWTEVGTGSSYTPGEVQEGHELRVVVSYAESTGTESITQQFGTVAEKDGGDLAATYSRETAQQGQQINVTAVTDGGANVSQQAQYSWQVRDGDGWTPVGAGSSYTPGEAQEGHELRVVVSYTESTGAESITHDFGTVAEKDGG
ncbi:FecR domain-containing protein, partial [Bradyrhizobium sp.]|uniref:FecR domain-containing protein n=1 Tax=Bradyrhizobium sp. TaxID=376 RepID=UPI001ED1324F